MRITRTRLAVTAFAVVAIAATGAIGAVPAVADDGGTAHGPEPVSETTGCTHGVWPDEVQGRPATLEPGAARGLYLWHDDHGWHAFVTHPGDHPVLFKATVQSSGRIYGVERVSERGDDVTVNPSRTAVRLRAVNFGHLDGMAFRTACAQRITVSGTINGRPIQAGEVFLGADGSHPTSVPFVIERQHV